MAGATKPKKQAKTSKISARKRARQSGKKQEHNRAFYSRMRNQIRQLRALLAGKNKLEAAKSLQTTLPIIAKMAGKKIIHHKTAARYTSRLTRQFNQL